MINLEGVHHHRSIDEIVDVLCSKLQNNDRGFFNAAVAYFLGKISSCMRVTIQTKDRGDIPVNVYTLALATSGYGKGHSVNILEQEIFKEFKKTFYMKTMPHLTEKNLFATASEIAVRKGQSEVEILKELTEDHQKIGPCPFEFDSGTPQAVKDLRQSLLISKCGSLNFQMDEVGSNIVNNTDLMNLFLELYDKGYTKDRIIKNTRENKRFDHIDGITPANMLMFGTDSKLFDGAKTEEAFYTFLSTGYARRCIYGYGNPADKDYDAIDPAQVYFSLINPENAAIIKKWSSIFEKLAHIEYHEHKLSLSDEVAIKMHEYRLACEKFADTLPEHEEIRKAEIRHRYFKSLKLAGAYAFIDNQNEILMEHLLSAILLVEESGECFKTILKKEKPHVKLAKYIASVEEEITHADLVEALSFYRMDQKFRNDIMALATAWGYKNNVIIKKHFRDGIEFFSGETLKKTNLNEVMISYSDDFAKNYMSVSGPFKDLELFFKLPDLHWCNHAFESEHRLEENAKPGFNLIVLDVDGGIKLETVHELLKDYTFITYTTKRSTDSDNRFRIVMPTNYILKLDTAEYKEFMNSFMSWFPFEIDDTSNQRSKKWLTHDNAVSHYNEGELIDVLPFIPKTSRNEEFKNQTKQLQSLDNLERWFAKEIASGYSGRNNNLVKFALALVDSGLTHEEVKEAVKAFNSKLPDPLPFAEIEKTIMKTVAKKYQES